ATGTLMRSGARPAPRLGFSIGNGGFWRAWESIAGVQIPHSSTRKCFGEERMSPRAIPGSARRLRHIPTEEPLSFNPTARQNQRALPMQHKRSKAVLFAPSRYKKIIAFSRGPSPPWRESPCRRCPLTNREECECTGTTGVGKDRAQRNRSTRRCHCVETHAFPNPTG